MIVVPKVVIIDEHGAVDSCAPHRCVLRAIAVDEEYEQGNETKSDGEPRPQRDDDPAMDWIPCHATSETRSFMRTRAGYTRRGRVIGERTKRAVP